MFNTIEKNLSLKNVLKITVHASVVFGILAFEGDMSSLVFLLMFLYWFQWFVRIIVQTTVDLFTTLEISLEANSTTPFHVVLTIQFNSHSLCQNSNPSNPFKPLLLVTESEFWVAVFFSSTKHQWRLLVSKFEPNRWSGKIWEHRSFRYLVQDCY